MNTDNLTESKKKLALLRRLIRGIDTVGHELTSCLDYVRETPHLAFLDMNYNQYWQVRGLHSVQPRYEIFASFIKPNSTVLDIGCGEGLLLQYLHQTLQTTGFGVDVSLAALKMAQERGVRTFAADITTWQVNGEYDYIIMSEVIEHLANPEPVLLHLKNHFRHGLLISVPNIGYYPHRFRLLFGRFPLQWGWHPAEHLRYWTVVDFIDWVTQLGFDVAAIQSSNGFPRLHHVWPNLFGNQIVFVLQN